jgi:uracil-DNA glycosylase
MIRGMSTPFPPIPKSWQPALRRETEQPYYAELEAFVAAERAAHEVFPPNDEVYSALALTPKRSVKALILGQDPYPTPGHAHGLAFSVRPGTRIPGSLRNIFKELESDVGVPTPKDGSLVPWAREGVLLLNAVLTVRAGAPNSHKNKGWERFTDAVIRDVDARKHRVAFVLWGAYAQKKIPLIDASRHTVITGAHPSPLTRGKGFFGTRPFSRVNAALEEDGITPIDWSLS